VEESIPKKDLALVVATSFKKTGRKTFPDNIRNLSMFGMKLGCDQILQEFETDFSFFLIFGRNFAPVLQGKKNVDL